MKNAQFLVLFLTLVGCNDVVTTKADSIQDGGFGHGWLPSIMPNDTTNLLVNSNLDSNRSWGHFVLSDKNVKHLFDQCIHADDEWIFVENGSEWHFTIVDPGNRVDYRMNPIKSPQIKKTQQGDSSEPLTRPAGL